MSGGRAKCLVPGATCERPGYAPFVGLERLDRFYRQGRVIASTTWTS